MSGIHEPDLPTLFEWSGGLVPLRRMIDSFYDRVEADDELSAYFPAACPNTTARTSLTGGAEVLGGPDTYTAEHGGYESMLSHHLGLAITPTQRHRFASTMSLAAEDADLSADPEFRAAIIGCL